MTKTKATTAAATIHKMWGFSFPEDLHHVWNVACAIDKKHPLSAFSETIGVWLEGPFAVLAGGKPEKNLGRWTSDPPEFFSIAAGDTDGLHWGYVCHEPSASASASVAASKSTAASRFACAHFYSRDAWPITFDGTFFDVLAERLLDTREELEEELEESVAIGEWNDEVAKRIEEIDRQLLTFAKYESPATKAALKLSRKQLSKNPNPKPVAPTIDGLGVVCAPKLFEKLKVKDAVLIKDLRDDNKRTKHIAHARALLDKGKPGSALKIGRDLYAIMPEKKMPQAIDLLTEIYTALDRPILAKAIANVVPRPKAPRAPAKTKAKTVKKAAIFARGMDDARENLGATAGLSIDYHSFDKTLPARAEWRAMTKLTSLTLRGLKLPELPIDGLPLEDVELFECTLPTFPRALKTLSKTLKELTLVSFKLNLPRDLDFPNLERLELSRVGKGGKTLQKVPPFVLRAKKLYNLTLYYNRISELPEELCELNELRYLALQNNKLTELPDFFDCFPKLGTLSLENNALSTLPASIGALKKTLTMLSLGKNPLTANSEERARIKKLLPKTKIYWT